MYITLSHANGNDAVVIRRDAIVAFSSHGDRTFVWVGADEPFLVRESMEEIQAILDPPAEEWARPGVMDDRTRKELQHTGTTSHIPLGQLFTGGVL